MYAALPWECGVGPPPARERRADEHRLAELPHWRGRQLAHLVTAVKGHAQCGMRRSWASRRCSTESMPAGGGNARATLDMHGRALGHSHRRNLHGPLPFRQGALPRLCRRRRPHVDAQADGGGVNAHGVPWALKLHQALRDPALRRGSALNCARIDGDNGRLREIVCRGLRRRGKGASESRQGLYRRERRC